VEEQQAVEAVLNLGAEMAGRRLTRQASPEPMLDETRLTLLDHQSLDWGRIHRAVYLLHQHLHYEYPAPISNLRHRLMIVPPESYGDQKRICYRVNVSDANALVTSHRDRFGNHVVDLRARRVPQAIDFESWALVERRAALQRRSLPRRALADRRYLEPSALTEPDAALVKAARAMAGGGATGFELAHRINDWVYDTLEYTPDATDVRTTAADALSLGRGVCQDYAHVMLALCRLCGLPARYVSGQLLGEGGAHAWVEILLPAPDKPGEAVALALDPTNGRETNLSYLTIAVGRDFRDVTPTSGTFRGSSPGRLLVRKRLGLATAELEQSSAGDVSEATISA
jgi:transglutaminase-like putative cysteine protease